MDKQEKIIEFLLQEFYSDREGASLTAEDNLLEGGMIDSVGMMKLIQFLEETFSIKIDPIDMTFQNFIDVNAMDSLISNKAEK